ncbi:MAG TPA: beta-ketoacyl synthase N-terminal-like domain-containing protein, partial [Myxococcaceae bacterium]|nr:beta-ketoacyl synthase N-terminal-like domain-containing protein [Myxococcaceae bacterium]
MSERRVVITGTGLITALGTGTEKNWQALINGKSGIAPITRYERSKVPDCTIAGEVKDFNPDAWGIDRREARRMDLFTQYGVAAAEIAFRDSGITIGGDGPDRYTP